MARKPAAVWVTGIPPTPGPLSAALPIVSRTYWIGIIPYIFEVKFNLPVQEALRQIRNRSYGREHLNTDRKVIAVGLAFHHTPECPPRLECRTNNLATLNTGERDPKTVLPRA